MTYNAANKLLAPNLIGDRGKRIAFIDKDGPHSYVKVAELSACCANLLLSDGVRPGARLLLPLLDTVAFPICFLGAMQAGIVPIPLNTLLTAEDYAFIAKDCDAAAIIASEHLIERLQDLDIKTRYALDSNTDGWPDLWSAVENSSSVTPQTVTAAEDVAFWLYTSGTTGRPKGVMHAHANLLATAANYGQGILHLTENDVIFSAAKFFFAYGLGNAFTFPMAVGAKVVLLDGPPLPEAVKSVFDTHQPTVFFGVPTLYAMLLNTNNTPERHRLRHCVSAGEALPEAIFDRWRDTCGIEILDGIGSTEMLHIYMSNRQGDIAPGTSGTPVEGCAVKLVDAAGEKLERTGEIGDLYVTGPSMTKGYWNRPKLNADTFHGKWLRSGDKYLRTEAGAYVYCGRSDDLLKVGGVYVSPMEVENALLTHEAVAEAAVVGHADADNLIKPKAFVVAAQAATADAELGDALISHVAGQLAPYKRPRWVEFVDALPKTATSKIQRFKLRADS